MTARKRRRIYIVDDAVDTIAFVSLALAKAHVRSLAHEHSRLTGDRYEAPKWERYSKNEWQDQTGAFIERVWLVRGGDA